uniref:Urotensin 2 n=1 Tax=Sphenodon punctatus TaxID=8508 RepID=A0A8D0GY19_SPHPU
MHKLGFCCLILIGLSCPLLALPIIDSSEIPYHLSADEEDARLNLEALKGLSRVSLLQSLPGLLGAQIEDAPDKTGTVVYANHPRIAALSRLLAKDRKQYKKRGNLSECFWKYCV